MQRMIVDFKAARFGHLGLALFDLSVVKLFDVAALHAYQMVVMRAAIEFKHRLVGLEVVADQKAGLLKLRQHAVDRGQAGIGAVFLQQLVDIFRGQMPYRAALEQFENTQPRQGCLEPAGFKIFC